MKYYGKVAFDIFNEILFAFLVADSPRGLLVCFFISEGYRSRIPDRVLAQMGHHSQDSPPEWSSLSSCHAEESLVWLLLHSGLKTTMIQMPFLANEASVWRHRSLLQAALSGFWVIYAYRRSLCRHVASLLNYTWQWYHGMTPPLYAHASFA